MTQTPKIYKIDSNHRLLKGIEGTELKIEKILNTSFEKLGFTKRLKPNDLKRHSLGEIKYFLYLHKSYEKESVWKEFLPESLTESKDFFEQKLSLVLFAETDKGIFSVIGGNSYQLIVSFIDHSFGLDLFSRIMNPEIDEILSIKSRGITGQRAGVNEQFRNSFRIIDFIRFGKVPQEIFLRISPQICKEFFQFLQNKPNERLHIYVGKAFMIKKSVDFVQLNQILIEIGYILELDSSDYLSTYKEIKDDYVKNTFLIPELERNIFQDSVNIGSEDNKTQNRFEFDFCNPNSIEKFYEADAYVLKEKTKKGGHTVFKKLENKESIYKAVMRRAIEVCGITNQENFIFYLRGVNIALFKENKFLTSSNFLYHFSTELLYQNKPVFLVDTKWYFLKESFITDLKISTHHILKTYNLQNGFLDEKWDKRFTKKESQYNLLYKGKQNYLVLDTVIVDGLELCDILFFDERNVFLVHVKYGFNSKMRELTNQITLSAKRLKEALGNSNNNYLEKTFHKVLEKGIIDYDFDTFKSLFDKKIIYVLAYTSHLEDDLKVVDNIDKFTSNIARYSLVQCSSEMRVNYYDLMTYQIHRE